MKFYSSKFILGIVLTMILATVSFAQTIIIGSVADPDYNPVEGVIISVEGRKNEKTKTDKKGMFKLQVSSKKGALDIFSPKLGSENISFFSKNGEEVDLGIITLKGDGVSLEKLVVVGKGVIDIAEGRKTPVASTTIKKAEIQDLAQGNVDFTETMVNVPNIYISNQAGGFGDSKMYTRGFDQSNTAFLFNGQPINGMEDGKMYWSNWSGMTDIANAIQVQRGLGSSKLAISSVGGTINIITKATEKKKGGYVQFTTGNDSFFKGSIGYNSGLKGKWGYSVALSHWQAFRNYAIGTYGSGQNYFLSIGYKPNENNTLNLIITGAPQLHGQNFSKSLEGKLSYATFGQKWNPNFGFKDGKQFSWRQNYYHKPIINLNWDWTIDNKTSLSTVLYGSLGRGGGTGPLGNTETPFGKGSASTDYFRKGAEEYYDLSNGNFLFDRLVANNKNNVKNGAGSFNHGLVRRSSVNNHNWVGLVSNFNKEVNENVSFNFGLDGRMYKGEHFRQITNLLGLKSFSDTYKRAKLLGDNTVSATYKATPWAALFNYAKRGERVGYDNSEEINYIGAFSQVEYATDNFSSFFQGAISNQSYKRIESWSTIGYSEVINKLGYNLKGGASFTFSDNNIVFANIGYYSRQPYFDNIFTSNTNTPNNDTQNEKITGLEAGYKYETRAIKVNVNLYYTKWANRFYSTGGKDYTANGKSYSRVNFLYRGINQVHKGLEIDFKTRPYSFWNLNGYFTYGDWEYNGETPYDVRDDESYDIVDNGKADISGVKVGEAPQVTFGLNTNLKINRALSWNVGLNYYSKFYGYIKLRDLLDKKREGKDYQANKLNNYTLINTGVSYKIKFNQKQDLRFRANVLNLLNKSYISQQDNYGYFFGRGRTWNLSVTYNF